ncbi:MAG: AsmA-like C-terminal domain-containing protein [Desulfobulbaceae bacterium]|nr:AsmA-like C-terminal domain-containing protein [Desulfobulbaceae bacterium]
MKPFLYRQVVRLLVSLFVLCCILALAGGFAWWSLKEGVAFRQLSISSADIRNLSVRLDGGLIIRAEQVGILDSTAEPDLEGYVAAVKKWGHLIRELDVKQLNYRNHSMTMMYRNGHFVLENDQFALEASVAHDADVYHLALTGLQIKPRNLTLGGTGTYSRATERFLFTGFFRSPWVNGSLGITEYRGQVNMVVGTETFTSLAPVLDQLPIDREVVAWVAGNITAGQYRINQLRLRFLLEKWEEIGPGDISGTALAESVAVKFHPRLDPVISERVEVSLDNDRLAFALTAPRYRDRTLSGSSVHIDNLIGAETRLVINIRTETRGDEDIHEILARYDIRLPLLQVSGETRAELQLTLDLPEFSLHARGAFHAGQGEWAWNGMPVRAEAVDVALADRTITIRRADISYKDIIRTGLAGVVDVRARQADLVCTVDHLDFRVDGMQVLRASRVRMPVAVDFSTDPVTLRLPEWETVIRLHRDETGISIGSLRTVAPAVPLLDGLPFNEGYLHLAVRDPLAVRFDGEVEVSGSPLVLDGQPVTSFRFQGAGTLDSIEASANDERITIAMTDRLTIRLRDYFVVLDRNSFAADGDGRPFPLPVTVTGPKALLNHKETLIATGPFEYTIDGPDRTFGAELGEGRFLYEASGKAFTFTGSKLNAEIARDFITFADLSNGLLDVTLSGTPGNYNGYIEFTEVLIREYLVMNNLIAFLNTIPALATLSSPGFDQDGYRVQNGFVHFDVMDKLLTIRQLRADGITVNSETTGWVDFNERTLHLSMELFTMKDYSKIIGLIPLAGYALLGEDGSLSTSLEITGSLDEPLIQTNLARDILLSPLNILRRTVEWPFRQLEKLNGLSSGPPEPDTSDPGD